MEENLDTKKPNAVNEDYLSDAALQSYDPSETAVDIDTVRNDVNKQKLDLSQAGQSLYNVVEEKTIGDTDAKQGIRELKSNLQDLDFLGLTNKGQSAITRFADANKTLNDEVALQKKESKVAKSERKLRAEQQNAYSLGNYKKVEELIGKREKLSEREKNLHDTRNVLDEFSKDGYVQYDSQGYFTLDKDGTRVELTGKSQAEIIKNNTKILDNKLSSLGIINFDDISSINKEIHRIQTDGFINPAKKTEMITALQEKKKLLATPGAKHLKDEAKKSVTKMTTSAIKEGAQDDEGVKTLKNTTDNVKRTEQVVRYVGTKIDNAGVARADRKFRRADRQELHKLRRERLGANQQKLERLSSKKNRSKLQNAKVKRLEKMQDKKLEKLARDSVDKSANIDVVNAKKRELLKEANQRFQKLNENRTQHMSDYARLRNEKLNNRLSQKSKRLGQRIRDKAKEKIVNSKPVKFAKDVRKKATEAAKKKMLTLLSKSKFGRGLLAFGGKLGAFGEKLNLWKEGAKTAMKKFLTSAPAKVFLAPFRFMGAIKKLIMKAIGAVLGFLMKIIVIMALFMMIVTVIIEVANFFGWDNEMSEEDEQKMNTAVIEDLRQYESSPYLVFNQPASAYRSLSSAVSTVLKDAPSHYPESWVIDENRTLLNDKYRLWAPVYEDPIDAETYKTKFGSTVYNLIKYTPHAEMVRSIKTLWKTAVNYFKTGENKLGGYAVKNYYGEFDTEATSYEATIQYGTYHEGYWDKRPKYVEGYYLSYYKAFSELIYDNDDIKDDEDIDILLAIGYSIDYIIYNTKNKTTIVKLKRYVPGYWDEEEYYVEPWWTYEPKTCTVLGLPGMTDLGYTSYLKTQLTEDSEAFRDLYNTINPNVRIRVEYQGSDTDKLESDIRNYTIDEFYEAIASMYHGFGLNLGFAQTNRAEIGSSKYMHYVLQNIWNNAEVTLDVERRANPDKVVTWHYVQDKHGKSDGSFDDQTCTAIGYDAYVTVTIRLKHCGLHDMMAIDQMTDEDAHDYFSFLEAYNVTDKEDSGYTEFMGWGIDSDNRDFAEAIYPKKTELVRDVSDPYKLRQINQELRDKYNETRTKFWETYRLLRYPSAFGAAHDEYVVN